MSQKTLPKCPVCDEDQFDNVDGMYYCMTCCSQVPTVIDAEVEDFAQDKYKFSTKRKKIKEEGESSKYGCCWSTFEGFQFVLKEQVKALIELGADPKLKDVVFDLWVKYLARLRIAFHDDHDYSRKRKKTRKEGEDEEEEEEEPFIIKYPTRSRDVAQFCSQGEGVPPSPSSPSPSAAAAAVPPPSPSPSAASSSLASPSPSIRTTESPLPPSSSSLRAGTPSQSPSPSSPVPAPPSSPAAAAIKASSPAASIRTIASPPPPSPLSPSLSATPSPSAATAAKAAAAAAKTPSRAYVKRMPRSKGKAGATPSSGRRRFTRSIFVDVRRMCMGKTIAFCYLGLLYTNHLTMPSDLVRWIRNGKLPYLDVSLQFPENFKFFAEDTFTFTPPNVPSSKRIRLLCGRLVHFLQIADLPRIPILKVIHKCICRLHLPGELHGLAANIISPKTRVFRINPDSLQSLPPMELFAMAYVVVLTKMLFTLDGANERKLSSFAAEYSRLTEDGGVFVWDDWINHMTSIATSLSLQQQPLRPCSSTLIQDLEPFLEHCEDSSYYNTRVTALREHKTSVHDSISSLFRNVADQWKECLPQKDANRFKDSSSSLTVPTSSTVLEASGAIHHLGGKNGTSSSSSSPNGVGGAGSSGNNNNNNIGLKFRQSSISYRTNPETFLHRNSHKLSDSTIQSATEHESSEVEFDINSGGSWSDGPGQSRSQNRSRNLSENEEFAEDETGSVTDSILFNSQQDLFDKEPIRKKSRKVLAYKVVAKTLRRHHKHNKDHHYHHHHHHHHHSQSVSNTPKRKHHDDYLQRKLESLNIGNAYVPSCDASLEDFCSRSYHCLLSVCSCIIEESKEDLSNQVNNLEYLLKLQPHSNSRMASLMNIFHHFEKT